MRTRARSCLFLVCFLSGLVVAPTAVGEPRPPARPAPSASGKGDAAPVPAPGPDADKNKEEDGPAQHRNDERDPARRRRYDHRRADAVQARHLARDLWAYGTQAGDPLSLVAAAAIVQATPAPRPLVQAASSPQDAEEQVIGAENEDELRRRLPSEREIWGKVMGRLEPRALLADARALAVAKGGEVMRQTAALIDRLTRSEVVQRGAAFGPQQGCERVAPGMKMNYHIAYEAGEEAVLAVAGDGPGVLIVSVEDEEGHLISRSPDRSLVSWYPRWRGVFRISVENRAAQTIGFCLETN